MTYRITAYKGTRRFTITREAFDDAFTVAEKLRALGYRLTLVRM